MRKILIGTGAVAIILLITGLVFLLTKHDSAGNQTGSERKTYVALGDSVAAGIGAGEYLDASACDRTYTSYPKQLAEKRNYSLTDYACSGAAILAGILGTQNVNGLDVEPQLDRLLAGKKPDVITLTIGANDVNWTRFVSCYTSVCGGDTEREQLQGLLSTFDTNLNDVLSRIKSAYSSPPRVVVTGYYQVLPKNVQPDCQEMTGIDESELAWARQVFTSLNDTIETTVKDYSFATYAYPDFSGHELCTSDPWVQTLSDKVAYHPNEQGSKKIAETVMATIDQKR